MKFVLFIALLLWMENSDCAKIPSSVAENGDDVDCKRGNLRFDTKNGHLPITHQCKEGGVIELECPVCGIESNNNAKIEWLMNNLPTTAWPSPTRRSFKDTAFEMKIRECQKVDSGNYTCEISYKNSTMTQKISHTFGVHVETKLHPAQFITEKPQNKTVRLGDSCSFRCPLAHTDNPDLLTVTWYRNRTEESQEIIGGEYLNFTNVSLNDEGWYSCRVVDNEDKDTYADVYLTVIDPTWYEENKIILIVVGTLVLFSLGAAIVVKCTSYRFKKYLPILTNKST